MSENNAIIIGAGLGGLVCGKLLSRRGLQVTLLEQGWQAGGALQTFVRDGIRFDTGFHSVGGLRPGEPLEIIFRQLGLENLPWIQMEPDEIIGGTGPFLRLSSGWEEERRHVLEPYDSGIWRLEGGGKTLVDALSHGLDIRFRKKVTALEDHRITCADGSTFRGDIVVAAIHPQVVLGLLRDPVRPAYRKHIESMENGPGVYTVYAKLLPGRLKQVNHSIFVDDQVMIHFGDPGDDGFARSLSLLAFETPDQVGGDVEDQVGGDERHARLDRASIAEDLIRKAAKRLPGLPEAIEQYWTSTPQTWERYTGTPGGTAYGLLKHGPEDFLSPQTPLPWLYLTGQNLGLHGVLGTAVSAFNTCKSISL